MRPTDLRQIVDRVVQGVQSTTERHQLFVEGPEQIEGVWDEPLLAEVIENLLINAVKYSPRGGPIAVRLAADDDRVEVRVSDRGLGLSQAALRHVFERYYRARRTRQLEGSGLGLYICQGIVSAHGGRIWATSGGPGQGSTFCFALPLHVPHAAEAAQGPRRV